MSLYGRTSTGIHKALLVNVDGKLLTSTVFTSAVLPTNAATESTLAVLTSTQAVKGETTAANAVCVQGDPAMEPLRVTQSVGAHTLLTLIAGVNVDAGVTTLAVDCLALVSGSLFIKDTSFDVLNTSWGVRVFIDAPEALGPYPLFDANGVDFLTLPRKLLNGVMFAQISGLDLSGVRKISLVNNAGATLIGVNASLVGRTV